MIKFIPVPPATEVLKEPIGDRRFYSLEAGDADIVTHAKTGKMYSIGGGKGLLVLPPNCGLSAPEIKNSVETWRDKNTPSFNVIPDTEFDTEFDTE